MVLSRDDFATNYLLFRVFQLIETFDGSREGSEEPQETTAPKDDNGELALSELKQNRQRRGSLQVLNVVPPEEEEEASPTKRRSDHAKQLRDHPNMTSAEFLDFLTPVFAPI